MNRAKFIQEKGAVVADVSTPGVLPSVIMAQAILESNWGESSLASTYNNYFGMKAPAAHKGNAVFQPTTEGEGVATIARFKVYRDFEDSLRDYLELMEKPRYEIVNRAEDYKSQARALKMAGYATDPEYPDKIIRVIETNNLQIIDKKAMTNKQITIITGLLLLAVALLNVYKIFK